MNTLMIDEMLSGESLLPSYEELDYFPEEDDLMHEVLGHHGGGNFASDSWDI